MLLFPGLTALDLVGPQELLAGLAPGSLHFVAEAAGPVASDTGLSLLATHTFETCPRDLDVLFVPGGDGTPAQMRDARLLALLRDRAERAAWVTSVCTGSLILGAAGLLRGYRATSHWCVRDAVLPLLGAEPVA
ncbi:DJ-1/PfpI family protein, partial [Methylobacterium sp. E-065]|uniref:DJ-1/PfpI family protein n=1 Tax=Methylobacterium sp. E-065 TaxID=2836583 RepID=UPI001FBBF4F9